MNIHSQIIHANQENGRFSTAIFPEYGHWNLYSNQRQNSITKLCGKRNRVFSYNKKEESDTIIRYTVVHTAIQIDQSNTEKNK